MIIDSYPLDLMIEKFIDNPPLSVGFDDKQKQRIIIYYRSETF